MIPIQLAILAQAATTASALPAFRTPRLSPPTNQAVQWDPITYGQFSNDIELVAQFWSAVFHESKLPTGAVIGLWLDGYSYLDLVHIYAISKAGFVPQLFSIRLPDPQVVLELLVKSGAQYLIHDLAFGHALQSCHIPTHPIVGVPEAQVSKLEEIYAPDDITPEGIAMYFHTSGSTAGSPKLVPVTFRGMEAAVRKLEITFAPRNSQRRDVTTWMGSVCHVGQFFAFLGRMRFAACTIIPTSMAYSDDELFSMVEHCDLNCLNQYSGFMIPRLKEAMSNLRLANLLRNFDQVLYCGMTMPVELEDWIYSQGIRATNLFGGTEIAGGLALLSVGIGPYARMFKPIEGTSYVFQPVSEDRGSKLLLTNQLLELVVLSESDDCPHPSLRMSDGHFHTGDLFIEPLPGHYVFMGRDDDWIKSENSLRCDTKSIEDNVYMMCSTLVAACIVVGTGRPSPTLFIEPANPEYSDIDTLKKEILKNTRPFHIRRYLHERIMSPDMVVVVPSKSLPRTITKGNIRRKAVEETYELLLDEIYSNVTR